jgi:hypothetical protein
LGRVENELLRGIFSHFDVFDLNMLHRTFLYVLFALSCVVYLGKSYEPILRGIDSNIHAAASLDVTSEGIAPKLPILLNSIETGQKVVFNDHPFTYFWLNGLFMRVTDKLFQAPSGWSSRVLTGLFSVGCVFLVYLIGAAFHLRVFGSVAALFMLFCRDLILTGATMSLDPPMLFFILLSFLFYARGQWKEMGIACGLGLWIKTPLVLLVFPVAILNLYIFKDKRIKIPQLVYAGVISVAIGSLVWIATGVFDGSGLVTDYWNRQVWGTAVEGRSSGFMDWTLGFQILSKGFLPGLPFLILGALVIFKNKLTNLPLVRISLMGLAITFGFVTLLRFKLGHYFNPAFPFLAFLSTYSVFDWIKKREEKFYAVASSFAVLLMAFVICTPISLGPEVFHLLRRAIPIIQKNASCKTPVFITEGAEPIGSISDYSLVLDHYVRRPIQRATCGSLQSYLKKNSPFVWIGPRDQLEGCIGNSKSSVQIFHLEKQAMIFFKFPEKLELSLWDQPLRADQKCYTPDTVF